MDIHNYLLPGSESVLLAHTSSNPTEKKSELLTAHSKLVMQFVQQLKNENGLEQALQKAIQNTCALLTFEGNAIPTIIDKWFHQAIYLHDLGKINPVFQRKKMNNPHTISLAISSDSSHALLSSLLYLHIHLPTIDQYTFSEDKKENRRISRFLKHILYAFAYLISRHHTYLGEMDELHGELSAFEGKLTTLERQLTKHPAYLYYYRDQEDLLKKIKGEAGAIPISQQIMKSRNYRSDQYQAPFPFYILAKLLYSTMVACDFYATYTFYKGESPPFQYFSPSRPIEPILEAFRSTDIYRSIDAYRHSHPTSHLSPINQLRSELFIETEHTLKQNTKENIYSLEAPTGAGKTIISINLGLTILQKEKKYNKLIYVFPFNTLTEQTKQTLDHLFPPKIQQHYRMQVINSVTPITRDTSQIAQHTTSQTPFDHESDIPLDAQTELLYRQMLQYPVTLTSHVQFFHYLFGSSREANLALVHLCNSVVIIDEIQSYRNEIWKEIIYFLNAYADILHIKIIIMSATLPKLDQLHQETESPICSLVRDRNKYFQNPIFKNRVHLHYELLDTSQKIDERTLLDKILLVINERKMKGKSTRLLIEFITKKRARSFYEQLLQENITFPIFELTGDDSPIIRKQVLRELGKDTLGTFMLQDVIVVATQVIEAGVDIDMDIGFKDISVLDSEEQFLGRINRSCLREDSHAYFFDMDDETKIYKKDKRTELNLRDPNYQQMLKEKQFEDYYALCMKRLNEDRMKINTQHWSHFTTTIQQLQYPEIEKRMTLIPQHSYQLFIAHQITYRSEDGAIIPYNGEEVWRQYKEILSNKELDYASKKIQLSQIQEIMSYFIFQYHDFEFNQIRPPRIYDEVIGNIYFVSDGERFMIHDEYLNVKKFNRNAYKESGKRANFPNLTFLQIP